MRIRGFLGFLVFLTCLPVALFSAYLALERTRIEQEAVEGQAQLLARDVSIVLDRQLVAITSALEVLSDSRSLDDNRHLSDFYQDCLVFLRHYGNNVVLVNPEGMQLLSTRAPLSSTPQRFADADAARQTLASLKPVASDVEMSTDGGGPRVNIMVPVVRDGQPRYALGVSLPVDSLAELISGLHIPEGWAVSILDSRAQRIVSRPDGAAASTVAEAPLAAAITHNTSGRLDRPTSEGRLRDFFVRSTQAPWTLVVEVPAEELARPVRRASLELLAASVVVVLLAALVASVQSGRLSRAVAGLATGGFAEATGIREVDVAAHVLRNARQQMQENDRQLREARDRAERANQAKSRFLAAASHDLRQPFQAMALYREVLNGRITDPKDRVVLEALGKAMTAGQELLSSLLQISVLDAGTERPDIQPVALEGILDSLVEEMRPQAASRGLELRYHRRTCAIHTDPVLLARMLRNLINNAMKYTGKGAILVGSRRRGDLIRVEIWDTGVGIPDDKREEIWEEFIQLHNPERDRSRGLGLGLAVVAKTARLLGHEVGVRSRPGKGSVFFVTMRRSRAQL